MERVNGIEPSYPAWKAGALTVVLHPLGKLIRRYFDPTLIPPLDLGEGREGSSSGGEGRIRTSEGLADRFTVCSLWPLGNLTTFIIFTSGPLGTGRSSIRIKAYRDAGQLEPRC